MKPPSRHTLQRWVDLGNTSTLQLYTDGREGPDAANMAMVELPGTEPVVAFYDNAQGGKLSVAKLGSGASWWNGWSYVRAGISNTTAAAFELAVAPGGYPALAYWENSAANFKLCFVEFTWLAAGSSTSAPATLVPGVSPEFPCPVSNPHAHTALSLAYSADGTPHIAYLEAASATTGYVKVIRRVSGSWVLAGANATAPLQAGCNSCASTLVTTNDYVRTLSRFGMSLDISSTGAVWLAYIHPRQDFVFQAPYPAVKIATLKPTGWALGYTGNGAGLNEYMHRTGFRVSVKVLNNGNPCITWVDIDDSNAPYLIQPAVALVWCVDAASGAAYQLAGLPASINPPYNEVSGNLPANMLNHTDARLAVDRASNSTFLAIRMLKRPLAVSPSAQQFSTVAVLRWGGASWAVQGLYNTSTLGFTGAYMTADMTALSLDGSGRPHLAFADFKRSYLVKVARYTDV